MDKTISQLFEESKPDKKKIKKHLSELKVEQLALLLQLIQDEMTERYHDQMQKELYWYLEK